jgi:hypothetical protein
LGQRTLDAAGPYVAIERELVADAPLPDLKQRVLKQR